MTVRLDSKFSEQINTCEFRKALNLAYGQGGLKLEINIPPQHILAKSKGGLIIEGGVSSSEYGKYHLGVKPVGSSLEANLRVVFILCCQAHQLLVMRTADV